MNRMGLILVAACALVAGCGDDDSPGAPSATAPVMFAAQLNPANEVPPVTGSESSARGAVQVTFDTTRTAATLYFQVTGLPAGTNLVGAHIHPGVAGVNGGVIVNTGLTASAPLVISGSAVEFSATVGIDPALAQSIINNPAAFYFNVHTPANPGGVARGQLSRIQ